MSASKVYFTDMRCKTGTSLLRKLEKLIASAGMERIDMQDKFVAIKLHFGEPGNLSFLRPNFAKTVVDAVRKQGGKPFLTDCNTLYVGRRKDALEHIAADPGAAEGAAYHSEVQGEAVQALVALGYGRTEALRAVKQVDIGEAMEVEEVLKLALKGLS